MTEHNQVLDGKTLPTLYQENTLMILLVLLQMDLWTLKRLTLPTGQENTQTFLRSTDKVSDLTLIPRDLNHQQQAPYPSLSGGWGEQGKYSALEKNQITVGPSHLKTHPVVIFPIPEWMLGIDILGNDSNPHTGSLTSSKMYHRKPLNLPSSCSQHSQSKTISSGRSEELSATIRNLKYTVGGGT